MSFDLSVETNDPRASTSRSAARRRSWKAILHGGGYVVGAVQTDGTKATTVRLDVDVPADATGSTKLTVTATSGGDTATLPLDIKVQADAGGEVTVTPDYTALRGVIQPELHVQPHDRQPDARGPDATPRRARARTAGRST